MSDYLFTSQQGKASELTNSIQKIYQAYEIECHEFEGEWGSLSVSPSPYKGLQPFETDHHIFIVLGGPVFYFRDNSFLTGDNPTEGTQALLGRFLAGKLDLENDVSGPFQLLIVDKLENAVTCITDLMLFIPAYVCKDETSVTFGSHVDAVARVVGVNSESLDRASIADFILHGVVTFPYTVYENIKQMHPATYHEYRIANDGFSESTSEPYWLPYENYKYDSVKDAAKALREGISKHIHAITDSMTHVAQFISGGEDSRTLSGLLPERLKRDAFVFLDSMNREGRIAKKVAHAYGARFHMGKRDPLHYIHIMDEASALVGSGHEYMHCHSLRFDKEFGLNEYSAVFGGYSSDVFLKGLFVRKAALRSKLGFVHEKQVVGESRSNKVVSELFDDTITAEITRRRRVHVEHVREFREESLHEWFCVWPATMRSPIPNHFCNRRLFASYEVFMSHEVLAVSASVPTDWKLNRKLFHSAFQPFLAKSKWIRHGDGGLPYFKLDVINGIWKMWSRIFYLSRKFLNRNLNVGPWYNGYMVRSHLNSIFEGDDIKIKRLLDIDVGKLKIGEAKMRALQLYILHSEA